MVRRGSCLSSGVAAMMTFAGDLLAVEAEDVGGSYAACRVGHRLAR